MMLGHRIGSECQVTAETACCIFNLSALPDNHEGSSPLAHKQPRLIDYLWHRWLAESLSSPRSGCERDPVPCYTGRGLAGHRGRADMENMGTLGGDLKVSPNVFIVSGKKIYSVGFHKC